MLYSTVYCVFVYNFISVTELRAVAVFLISKTR